MLTTATPPVRPEHPVWSPEEHARGILGEFVGYYNEERTHQALGGDSPLSRANERFSKGMVIAVPHLGGLHHSYRRAA